MHRLRSGIIVIFLLVVLSVAAAAHVDWGYENPNRPISSVDLPVNANLTGQEIEGSLLRLLPGESIHGQAMKNSNSCAVCHMTHTASAGQGLFQTSVYNACISCHSGDHSPSDVFSGALAGGRFYSSNVSEQRNAVSYHLATGARKVGDAPGALPGADAALRYTRRGEAIAGEWDKLFTCSSCHAPHGSYSDRLLHYNVNGQGKRDTQAVTALGDGKYRVVNRRANAPWLYYDPETYPQYAVVVYSKGDDITDQFDINYGRGELQRISGSSEPTHVSFVRPTLVTMDITANTVRHNSGIVAFCTSCHIGYLDNVEERTFAWHDNFYHEVGMEVNSRVDVRILDNLNLESTGDSQRLTCLTCHFAHGTDQSLFRQRGSQWRNAAAERWNLVTLSQDTVISTEVSTANLRYFNSEINDELSAVYEACYLCHSVVKLTPEVVQTSPQDEEFGVSTSSVIELEFDLTIAAVEAIILEDEDGEVVDGVISLDENIVRFEPTEELMPGNTYTLTVTNAQARIGGILESYQFAFHTFMYIEEYTPDNEAEDIEYEQKIEVILSHAIDLEALDGEEFLVTFVDEEGELMLVEGTLMIDDNKLIFTAIEELPAGQLITVVVGQQLKNLNGATLQEAFQWTFTTKSMP